MTAPERAAYLIKELGYDKAILHARWVYTNAIKQLTKDYWLEVDKEIHKLLYDGYDKTLRCHCRMCDTPIPEGTGYCIDCKPISHGKE